MQDTIRNIPPVISRISDIRLPEVRRLKLENGIEVLILDRCEQDINRITALWGGGCAEAKSPALAGMTVAAHREGSKTHSPARIADIFDSNGAWIKYSATHHHSLISSFSLNSSLDSLVPALVDIIADPLFPEKETDVIRQQFAANEENRRHEVGFHASRLSLELSVGKDHPLAFVSEPDSIRAITTESLRTFDSLHCRPDNMTLLLTGKITPSTEDKVLTAFATIPVSTQEAPKLDIRPFMPSAPGVGPIVIDRPGASQSAVFMTLPAVPRNHPDYVPLRLAVAALGGYFGSRLMLNIREDKGYTYGINALMLGYIDGAFIQISSECDNRYVHPLIDEVRREIERMATDPVCGEELQRLCQNETSALIDMIDSPFSIMDTYQNMITTGITREYFDSRLAILSSTTPEIIASMARKYLLPEKLITVIAGDKSKM